MQEIKKPTIISEPSRFSWFASLALLGIMFVSIIGLHIYQYFRVSSIESLHTEITQLDSSIRIASTDREVIIANILSSTMVRPPIAIRDIVKSFRNLATQTGVRFQ